MKTILVIEDDEAIGDNTVELLAILGFETALADDGQHGLTAICNKQPDLVFCDVQMPGISGYDVLRTIRADGRFKQLPFYFFSAKTEPADQEKGFAMGATGYLTKPFTEADLLNCICRHLPMPAQACRGADTIAK
ncbi:response regulator [Fibrella sp. HMF5335]|uniref:Response regulator n=1 Tax=Fibrella rubiginis TaxID=2817060 RepID=A0A939GBG7_9BACT|nr:response regulator [Fibrella rubiginis]MBO0935809.1 response regulator [Fibrella rubiginis]